MYLARTRRSDPATTDLYGSWTRLNRMMDEAFGRGNGETVSSAWIPSCDVREDNDHLTITLDLPGVKPEDVKLSLENNVLTVRGERRQEAEQKDERWHRYERSYGSFERSFTLPSTVDPERVQATTDHGVLTIQIPKVERARPREIPVKASVGSINKPETVNTKTDVTR
jgi:HSP20 family protein